MEEKQFKCQECDAKFGTLEQLQNHNRRHGMTINLGTRAVSSGNGTSLSTPSFGKGSFSAGVISFVDETPTPTRFIRNCEEVGLFQDLQNVNPFDEDFKKAANGSATPSGEATGFEISFSSVVTGVPGTPNGGETNGVSIKGARSRRRYSEQDTLNTPQVFPYFSSTGGCHTLTTNTASMSACLTPTPQTCLTNENVSGELHPTLPTDSSSSGNVTTTSYNHEEHVSIIAYTSAISQQTNYKNDGRAGIKSTSKPAELAVEKPATSTPPLAGVQQGRISTLKSRSKANLKLDLKTVISSGKVSDTLSEKTSINPILCNDQQLSESVFQFSTKKELLERNRAAAHRSRERRKQWIYGLESRCRALEALLAQSQAEASRLKAENEALRSQLHTQRGKTVCPVSAEGDVPIHPVSNDTTIIIHQAPQTELQSVVQEPLADNLDASSSELVIVSPIVLPTVKSKRGRPKKGEERRVPILAVPMISAPEEKKSLPKIPILPISQAKRSKVT